MKECARHKGRGFESPLNCTPIPGESTMPAFMPVDLTEPSERAFSQGRWR